MSEEKPEYKADPQANDVIASAAKQSPGIELTADPRITLLESSLREKDTALNEANKTIESQSADLTALKTAHEASIVAYRKLAVSSNPLFSDELITGSTIAEVDASMRRVTDLAGLVRSRIEADIMSVTVPAGAPERSAPDTSGLSPREKIKVGIQEKK